MSVSTPSTVVGIILAAVLVTLVVTPGLSMIVLRRYRRRVDSSMRAALPDRVDSPPELDRPVGRSPMPGSSPSLHILQSESAGRSAADDDSAWPRARRHMHHLLWVYGAAGLAYGLVAAIVRLRIDQAGMGPRALVLQAALQAWLLVPTALAILAAPRRLWFAVGAGYLAALLSLYYTTSLPIEDVVYHIVWTILPTAITALVFSARNLRAVAPFLAIPVLLASIGLAVLPGSVVLFTAYAIPTALSVVLAVAVAALLAVLGFAHLSWTARTYTRKRASDQMLYLSQWWFIATAWHSLVLLAFRPVVAALSIWLAYLTFSLVRTVGLRLVRSTREQPLRLLLLRVFGAQRRSEALLRMFGAYWRHLGPIQMIAGPDLVAAALEPHEFLELLRGRLSRQFVRDSTDLQRRVAELDEVVDPDGRYRINEIFCLDHTWRSALTVLVLSCDCTLVDARGLTPAHHGVAYEISQLVQLVPLSTVLVLTNDTTDYAFLKAVLDGAWQTLESTSPNRATNSPLCAFNIRSDSRMDLRAMISVLAGRTTSAGGRGDRVG